ncbi:hypothetical protein NBO_444g0011 [Nosema bombycis CQ1]|uniref:Uncharacterized protein n=1 Tax=Nosema bombycis (strain CQ1 / CVCC 102059) TaxID=578461 RepID=R0KQF6_NOSB1|nr:hypothetical protein NBO_444g0011 [Nosema bombycis CQ1]|eukprot:EOB12432.1 hypothetical protein NBO_444g0011 [Nosema bombycis CQ1]
MWIDRHKQNVNKMSRMKGTYHLSCIYVFMHHFLCKIRLTLIIHSYYLILHLPSTSNTSSKS